MTLRFEVDQAEAFRLGINVPKSTIHIEVNPSSLSQDVRNQIADRLDGIDVCKLALHAPENRNKPIQQRRIVAVRPTFDGLMDAIRKEERMI